mmetsp:Transcript_33927/g.93866  ORF Transcript_33927/g.93866 Transcript_33927/m.93866 type:complete len:226 (+) Transcript_33927:1718-2395(+)
MPGDNAELGLAAGIVPIQIEDNVHNFGRIPHTILVPGLDLLLNLRRIIFGEVQGFGLTPSCFPVQKHREPLPRLLHNGQSAVHDATAIHLHPHTSPRAGETLLKSSRVDSEPSIIIVGASLAGKVHAEAAAALDLYHALPTGWVCRVRVIRLNYDAFGEAGLLQERLLRLRVEDHWLFVGRLEDFIGICPVHVHVLDGRISGRMSGRTSAPHLANFCVPPSFVRT